MATFSKFTDDTKVMIPANTLSNCNLLQQDHNTLQAWANKWKMSYNIDKCKIMHLGVKNNHFKYTLYDKELTESDCEKDLGVYVNNKLKSNSHVSIVTKRANKIFGLISRTFEFKTEVTIINLFNALVRPHLRPREWP